jgi:calcineurin-like phosphoesterase family protein
MASIFFSSDHHLNHVNILKHCQRPFQTIEDMNEKIIDNHNSVVSPKDTVYFLGDFMWHSNVEETKKMLQRLNGRKHLLFGNHDNVNVMEKMVELKSLASAQQVLDLKIDHRHYWLSHYPHRSWPSRTHGSAHLFGHCHGLLSPHGRSFDVGVDAWDFSPVSLEVVVKTLEVLEQNIPDPHRENPVIWKGT